MSGFALPLSGFAFGFFAESLAAGTDGRRRTESSVTGRFRVESAVPPVRGAESVRAESLRAESRRAESRRAESRRAESVRVASVRAESRGGGVVGVVGVVGVGTAVVGVGAVGAVGAARGVGTSVVVLR